MCEHNSQIIIQFSKGTICQYFYTEVSDLKVLRDKKTSQNDEGKSSINVYVYTTNV